MRKENKSKVVDSFKGHMADVRSAFLIEYRGLTVADISDLRIKLRQADARLRIMKNTLARLAVKDSPFAALDHDLKGPIAFVTTASNTIKFLKVVKDFQNDHEAVVFKTGVLDGTPVTAAQIPELVDIPGMEYLMAKILGGLQAPMRGILAGIQGPMRAIGSILKQYAEKGDTAAQEL
ncbi:50S ribosomal protein L10 [bacterium]|nr:50S ribosomal protein L10 [candidate division CSSED10-310 bacterium]